jgi:hypothetical protein
MIVGGNGSGLPVAGIGALLGLQATRVRFEFDDEAMEVKLDSGGDKLADSGENFAVGGKVRTVPHCSTPTAKQLHLCYSAQLVVFILVLLLFHVS